MQNFSRRSSPCRSSAGRGTVLLAASATLAVLASCGTADLPGLGAGPEVRYEVRFPNAEHHEARVRITYRELPSGPLTVRMSRASPGRYAPHEFAVNVHGVSATDRAGDTLELERPDPHSWRVRGHDGTVHFAYTVFGDHASGTYAGIDRSHAHVNAPAFFAHAPSLADRGIRVRFHPPEGSGWRAATQLVPADGDMAFTAPDLDYFMDSPTELSDHRLRSWEVPSGRDAGGAETIRLAVHDTAGPGAVDSFAELARRVVREQRAIFGELPDFDHGSYTFIADYLPWVHGDGMEHRNSTVLTSTHSLAEGPEENAGTLAHEFFHAWSVERIRPEGLEPFDFARPERNMTDLLWLAEGFTSYYDDLSLRRAGVLTTTQFARAVGRTVDAVANGPGRRVRGPAQMSRMSPLVDGAAHVQRTNLGDTYVSYYTYGAALALGLDLTLRARFTGVSLDDVMRELWRRHGRTEEPYAEDDLRRIIADVTGDGEFARRYLRDHVENSRLPEFGPLLARAGFRVERVAPERAWAGLPDLEAADGGVRVAGSPARGTPLRAAGVARGDRILRVAGRRVEAPGELREIVSSHAPGDRLSLEFRGRGERRSAGLHLDADPTLRVRAVEASGAGPTDDQRSFREAWLGSGAVER